MTIEVAKQIGQRTIERLRLKQSAASDSGGELVLRSGGSDLSRPPRRGGGVIAPSFHATPNHLKFKGVIRGCLRDRDGRGNKRGQILT